MFRLLWNPVGATTAALAPFSPIFSRSAQQTFLYTLISCRTKLVSVPGASFARPRSPRACHASPACGSQRPPRHSQDQEVLRRDSMRGSVRSVGQCLQHCQFWHQQLWQKRPFSLVSLVLISKIGSQLQQETPRTKENP